MGFKSFCPTAALVCRYGSGVLSIQRRFFDGVGRGVDASGGRPPPAGRAFLPPLNGVSAGAGFPDNPSNRLPQCREASGDGGWA